MLGADCGVLLVVSLFIERGLAQLSRGVEFVHDGLGRLGELFVVQVHRTLVLLVEVLHPPAGVAIGADILHGRSPLLPVLQLEAHHWAEREADEVAYIVRHGLVASGAHVARGAGGNSLCPRSMTWIPDSFWRYWR